MSGSVWYISASEKKIEFKKYPAKKKKKKVKKSTRKNFLFILMFLASLILFSSLISAAAINDTFHINLQTIFSNGTIETGTFTFGFNITDNSSTLCGPDIVYNHSTSQTTDNRGIVSLYLPTTGSDGGNLSELSFDKQYYLCYYRDGTLKDVSQLGRVPYAFRATQVNLSEISVDSNLNMTDQYNITDVKYGFFQFLGSLLEGVTKLFATDVNISNNLSVGGNVSVTGNVTASWFIGKINASDVQNNNWIEDSQEASLNVNSSNYWDGLDTPSNFTIITASGLITGGEFSGPINWTNLQNYPGACPAGHAVQIIGDTLTCINISSQGSDTLDGYDSAYFMPLNMSVVGTFDFNGGWASGGLSIDSGDLYAQTIYVYNITSLNVSKQNLTVVDDLIVYGNTELKKNLTVDTTLFVDSNTDKVGIGTTSPADTLTVVGTLNATDIQLASNCADGQILKWSGGVGTCGTDNSGGAGGNSSAWNRSGTNVFLANIGDNVGIGTATPGEELEINSSDPVLRLRDSDTTNITTSYVEFGGTDGGSWNRTGYVGDYASTLNDLDIALVSQYGDVLLQPTSGNVGIGTTTIPHGGVGAAKFAIEGVDQNVATGPQIQITTNADDYPLMQLGYWSHDAMWMFWDAYSRASDGSDRSSDAGSNFGLRKTGDKFQIVYDSGIAQGSAVTWNIGMAMDTSGSVGIGTETPIRSTLNLKAANVLVGSNAYNMFIQSSDELAIDKGGSLGLGGDAGASDPAAFGVIAGRKESGAADYAGYLQFATIASNAVMTEKMRITSTGKVGIGTDSPNANLEIEDGGTANNVLLKVTADDGNPYGIVVGNDVFSTNDLEGMVFIVTDAGLGYLSMEGAGSELTFGTSSVQRMRIDSSGNVGIGTTTPGAKLEVSSASSTTELRISTTDTVSYNNPKLSFYSSYPNDRNWRLNTAVTALGDFHIQVSPTAGTTPTNSVLTILKEGKVGVGTTSPATILQIGTQGTVNSGVRIVTNSSATPDALQLRDKDNVNCGMDLGLSVTGGGLSIGRVDCDGVPIEALKIERATGNVGIGTTSPAVKLHIHEPAANAYEYITAGGGYQPVLHLGYNYSEAGEKWGTITLNEAGSLMLLSGGSLGSPGIVVDTSGKVGIGTTAPETTLHVQSTTGALISDVGGAGGTQLLYFGTANGYWNYYIGMTDTNILTIGGAGTDATPVGNSLTPAMTFDGGGYVGIGTTTPARGLHLSGIGGPAEFVITDTGMAAQEKNFNIWANPADNGWHFRTLNDAYSGASYHFMTFQADTGNVGIGLTNPSVALDVDGNIVASGTICDTGGTNCIGSGAGAVSGSGTTGKIPKWSGVTSLGDSIISESGSTITIADNVVASTFVAGEATLSNRLYMNSGTNLHLDSNGAGWTYINYYGGTGGVYFCNGANGCSASVSAAGAITGTTLNTGQGANELYDMDQNVLTGSSPTFVTAKLSALTDGYVPYHVSDASGLANSVIYTDGTNVGIGDTSPDAGLDVEGGYCAGTASLCYLFDCAGSTTCTNQDGCSAGTGYCDFFDEGSCEACSGCWWEWYEEPFDGECYGTNVECTGTPTACSTYTSASTCSGQGGCEWYNAFFTGNIGIGYYTPTQKIQLDSNTYGYNYGWVDGSDRNTKENFALLNNVSLREVKLSTWTTSNGSAIDAVEYNDNYTYESCEYYNGETVNLDNDELLQRLSIMPIMRWNFIDDDEGNDMYPGRPIYHISPTGQDFYKLFGLGSADTRIKSTDLAGVALAGVKALDEEIKAQQKEIESLKKEIELLKGTVWTSSGE